MNTTYRKILIIAPSRDKFNTNGHFCVLFFIHTLFGLLKTATVTKSVNIFICTFIVCGKWVVKRTKYMSDCANCRPPWCESLITANKKSNANKIKYQPQAPPSMRHYSEFQHLSTPPLRSYCVKVATNMQHRRHCYHCVLLLTRRYCLLWRISRARRENTVSDVWPRSARMIFTDCIFSHIIFITVRKWAQMFWRENMYAVSENQILNKKKVKKFLNMFVA